jgi:hypothetical protein
VSTIADRIRANRAAAEKNSDADLPPVLQEKKPLPPAAPCPECKGPGFWIDAYRNISCLACRPPKIPSLARQKILVCENPDGSFYWEPLIPPTEEKKSGSQAEEKKSTAGRRLSFEEQHHLALMDRLSRSCDGLTDPEVAAKVAEWNEHILAVQGGMLNGVRIGQRAPAPKPPAKARLWYILADGKHVEADSKKATEKNPAVLFTWEGAPTWWPIERTEIE